MSEAKALMELELKLREEVEGVECLDVTNEEIAGSIKLGEAMIKFCAENGGAGLAAPQVGFNKRLIVWMSKDNIFQIGFNPKFYKDGKKINTVEGCLSYPNEQYYVSRWKYIVAVYEVPSKERTHLVQIARKMRGEEAIIFQHETDHTNGKTIGMKGKLIEKKDNEVMI